MESYVKRKAYQTRIRATRAIIVEALTWSLLALVVCKGIGKAMPDPPAEEVKVQPVKPVPTMNVTVKVRRQHLPGLYGCPNG